MQQSVPTYGELVAKEKEPHKNQEKNDSKIIYFVQGHWGDFFNPQSAEPMRKAGYDLTPMYQLYAEAKKAGFDLRIAHRDSNELVDISGNPIEPFKYIIVFDIFENQLHYLKRYPKEKLILFLWEPPSVMPQSYDKKNHEIFSKVYTWRDDYIDNKKYFKIYYPVFHSMNRRLRNFKSKKLCALVASNRSSSHPDELYSERKKLAEFYEKNHPMDLDLYGRGWSFGFDGIYRGTLDDKAHVLKNYKFTFAYENIKDVPGYITEKLFDAFQVGTVPIYWGASNVKEYIPKGCFIARQDFTDEEALYQFIHSMTKEQYDQYIENIKEFLTSEKGKKFSSENFVHTVMSLILE